MTDNQPPVLQPAEDPPPLEVTPEPTGGWAVMPALGMIFLVLVIIGLIAYGGWPAFGLALALLVLGVFGVLRYVQRVAWTASSGVQLDRGATGMIDDLSVTDEVYEEPATVDLPPGSPARRELVRRGARRRRRQAERRPTA